MKISIVLLVLLGTFLSACTTQIGGYENHERQKGGDFCPPGQAKKGNC